MIKIDGVQFELNSPIDKALRDSIFKKLTFLFSTLKGSIPMNRNIGIDPEILASPINVAKGLYTVSVYEVAEEFETRVTIDSVDFEDDVESGLLIPKVVVFYNGE